MVVRLVMDWILSGSGKAVDEVTGDYSGVFCFIKIFSALVGWVLEDASEGRNSVGELLYVYRCVSMLNKLLMLYETIQTML